MNQQIPIHESENSDKVVKFIDLHLFTEMFQTEYNNNSVYGVFYRDGKIVYMDISGDIIENII